VPGIGTLTLTASNSYQRTFVNSGTLLLANGGTAGSGAVNLAAGTTSRILQRDNLLPCQ